MNTTIGPFGEGRFYIVDEEKDIKYPSVTTIIGAMSDKSWLEDWYARVGEENAKKITEQSANRGTFMHLLNENWIREKIENKSKLDNRKLLKKVFLITLEEPEIKAMPRPHLVIGKELFMNLYNNNIFDDIKKVVQQEKALFSKRGGGYAGRVDLICHTSDNGLKIIDFKSSRKPKTQEQIEGYKCQIAAYAVAFYDMTGDLPVGGEIWISNEQTPFPQIFKMDRSDILKYFELFQEKVEGYHQKLKLRIENSKI